MISLDHTLISDDLKEVWFCCDLEKCKGACCVEGDAGAPLETDEISLLEDHIEDIKPLLRPEALRLISDLGVFDYDADGNFVTPIIGGKECVYCCFEEGIARCAIEKAYYLNIIPFPKPVSCHLYPVRLKDLGNDTTAVNYHKWNICRKALEKGYADRLPLYLFLEDALIRKFGRSWFNRLVRLLH